MQYYLMLQDCVLRSAHAHMLPHPRKEGSRQSKSSLNTQHRRAGCACDEPSHAMEVTEVVMHFYMAASAASLLRSGAWAGDAQLARTCLSWLLSLAFLWESAKDPMQGVLKASGIRRSFAQQRTVCRDNVPGFQVVKRCAGIRVTHC